MEEADGGLIEAGVLRGGPLAQRLVSGQIAPGERFGLRPQAVLQKGVEAGFDGAHQLRMLG